jgi:hypothetical protein
MSLAPWTAAAQTDVAPQTRTIVMIESPSTEPVATALFRAVRAHLSDLPIDLRLGSADSAQSAPASMITLAYDYASRMQAAAVFWIDSRRPQRAAVRLLAVQSGRMYSRRFQARSGQPEVEAETVAIVVRSAVQALLRSDPIDDLMPGEDNRDEAADAAPVLTEFQDSDAARLSLSAAYVVQMFSHRPAGVVQGVVLGAGGRTASGLWLFGGYRLLVPETGQASLAQISVRRHPMFLTAGWSLDVGQWSLGGGICVTADVTTIDAAARQDGVTTIQAGPQWYLSVAPVLRGQWQASESLSALVEVGADIPFRPVRYVVDVGDRKQALMAQAQVSPRVLLGAILAVW